MAVELGNALFHSVDFSPRSSLSDFRVNFPIVYRYDQTIAQVSGNDAHETGNLVHRRHYGYGAVPAIRIANLLDSVSTPRPRLDPEVDDAVWILCQHHATAAERSAYASAAMMLHNPDDGITPAAFEYVSAIGHYTIVTRKPPRNAPSHIIAYSSRIHTGDGPTRIETIALGPKSEPIDIEAFLFSFVPLPDVTNRI